MGCAGGITEFHVDLALIRIATVAAFGESCFHRLRPVQRDMHCQEVIPALVMPIGSAAITAGPRGLRSMETRSNSVFLKVSDPWLLAGMKHAVVVGRVAVGLSAELASEECGNSGGTYRDVDVGIR